MFENLSRFYFNEGQKALEEGAERKAIDLLEKVIKVYPHFSVVNSLLGDAYLKNGNSVKAIRIFEKLAVDERNNAGFLRRLAHAYDMRGWHLKAIEQYRRALSLDEDNISLWLGLINCYHAAEDYTQAHKAVWEGLEVSNRKGWDNLELYDEEEDYQLQPYRRPEPKVGRNEPCPCGSGKKYKKCCGK
ncbi:MAG: tetratricopeptide repeat protein [Bacillota bacterium]|nr:tetratricopeptide repeat protein [Bacillota bacterium]